MVVVVVLGERRDSKRVGGFRLVAGYVGLVQQALVNHGDGFDTILDS